MQKLIQLPSLVFLCLVLLCTACKKDHVVQTKSSVNAGTTDQIGKDSAEKIQDGLSEGISQISEKDLEPDIEKAKMVKVISDKVPVTKKKPAAKKVPSTKKKSTQKKSKTKPRAMIAFDDPFQDFGTIMEGDTVDFKFTFTNKGKGPLDISSAVPTCGCTLPSFPFIPVEPGEEGYIGVKYISIGKQGEQTPSIEVTSNGSVKPIILTMKGFVEPKPKEEILEQDTTAMSSDSIRE